MPFYDDTPALGQPVLPRSPGALLPDPSATPVPTFTGVIGAAAREENAVVSAINWASERSGMAPDPSHNPIDVIGGTPFERQHLSKFVGSQSEAETRSIMARIAREEADDKLLDAAGWGGTVARIGMGILDPTLFIPGGAVYRSVRTAETVGRTALSVGIAAGAQAAASEAVLYGTQETRTLGEVGANVAGATILGGILGGAIGVMSAKEIADATKAFDDVRRGIDTQMSTGVAQPVGAAVDRRALTLEPALGAEKALAPLSPVTRLQTSPFDSAKAAVRDLADAGLSYRQNWDFVPTSEGGTVETRTKMWNANIARATSTLDDAYARYFFDKADVSAFERRSAAARSGWSRLVGDDGGKMSFQEFREEVGKAMARGDQHPIPQVAEAAQKYRNEVFDPLWKEAQAQKLVSEPGSVPVMPPPPQRPKPGIVDEKPGSILIKSEANQGDMLSLKEEPGVLHVGISTVGKERRGQGVGTSLYEKALELAGERGLVLRSDMSVSADALRVYDVLRRRGYEVAEAPGTMKSKEGATNATAGYVFEVKPKKIETPEEVAARTERAVLGAESYITRVYDRVRINAERDKFTNILKQHFRLQRDAHANKLKLAGKEPDRFAEMDENAITDLVQSVIQNIMGESASRLAGLRMAGKGANPLQARVLTVPDELLEPYLVRDIEKVSRAYVKSLAGDVELARKFGDPQMTEPLKKLEDEYKAKQAAATSRTERERLEKEYKAAARDMGALRDRIRGTYQAASDPDGIMARAGRMALQLNYLARLGGMTISSLTDVARPIMRYGLNAFKDGWAPLVTNLGAVKLSAREVRLAGTALDMVRDQRLMEIGDILDDFGRGSRFERGVQAMTDRFGLVTLMSPWNGAMKSMAGVITMAEVLRAAKAVATGKPTAKQIQRLAADGVDEAMARRIWAEAEKSGNDVNGVFLPNTESWTDQAAVQAFRAVINREVDSLIVTPGLEKPLWMSSGLGRIIGQFKSFAAASTQRTMLAGIQQRDAAALAGVMTTLALGAVSAKVKSELRGEDTKTWTSGRWAAEALDNSGLLGIIGEAGNIADKWTGGKVGLARLGGKEVSRYQSRNAVGALLGPTFDFAGDLAQVTRATATGEVARTDLHALRQVLPYQNLFYIRGLFDKAENAIGDRLGLPAKRERAH